MINPKKWFKLEKIEILNKLKTKVWIITYRYICNKIIGILKFWDNIWIIGIIKIIKVEKSVNNSKPKMWLPKPAVENDVKIEATISLKDSASFNFLFKTFFIKIIIQHRVSINFEK